MAGDSQAVNASGRDTTNHFLTDTAIVRGLYVNRFAAQSSRRMKKLIALADSTEINAFVVDMKDEFGLNYQSSDAKIAPNTGRMGAIPNLKALLDTLKAHDILAIARLVVFKDSVAARTNPGRTIRKEDGTTWRDRQGLAWVNPYDKEIWEYNIRVAEEMVRLGFPEVQFDYIRFPEPYRSLPKQVFPEASGLTKADALADFLKTACGRINKLGGRCTADVFGLITTVNGALEIGQDWKKLSPVADVLLPMVYPSHYPRGAFGIDRPNSEPYKIIYEAIAKAHERDRALGIKNPEHVRAWLQAFSIGQPKYGAAEIEAQKKAVYDAGYDGWVLWHPGSLYEPFVNGLERTTVSRKQGPGTRNQERGSP
ncbi:MAG: GTP-binding protein [Anaerolineae bacterium]|nr:GTP-binding protein [Gemmatimonadaceae bacterium]